SAAPRTEDPALGSGHRIERHDAVKRCAQHEPALDEDRYGLLAALLIRLAAPFDLARAVCPGDFEFVDVLFRDLTERRVPCTALVVTVFRPVVASEQSGCG